MASLKKEINSIDKINEYIESGGNIDMLDCHNFSILHYSVMSNSIDIVKYLVGRGADINVRGSHGVTPLMLAVNNDYHDIVRYLIDSGADINMQDEIGRSTLLYASTNHDEDAQIPHIKYLLDKGADKGLKCHGLTVSEFVAQRYKHVKFAAFIESYEPIPTKGVQE